MLSHFSTIDESRPLAQTGLSSQTRLALTLATAAILTPLVFHGSQWLAGTLVNFLLVLGALRLRRTAALVPLIVLPSLVAAGVGMLSSHLSPGLILLLPTIWLGNAALAGLIRISRRHWVVPAAAIVKTAIILAAAAALVSANLLPALFVEVIAPLQMVTAVAGALAALGAHSLLRPMQQSS